MEKLAIALLAFVPLLFSLSVHEAAHAWMADRKGDPTAKMLGRVSLSPLPHIDPFGTILFPAICFFTGFPFLFGWAKPVPVNERNLRHPRWDGLWVAAAGPLSNLLLAFVFALAYGLFFHLGKNEMHLSLASSFHLQAPLQQMLFYGIHINAILAFFNLLPMPPLDGGRVLEGFFPELSPKLRIIEQYGFFILMGLMFTGLLQYLVYQPSQIYTSLLLRLTGTF